MAGQHAAQFAGWGYGTKCGTKTSNDPLCLGGEGPHSKVKSSATDPLSLLAIFSSVLKEGAFLLHSIRPKKFSDTSANCFPLDALE
jgi:hypothetical protein